MESVLAAVGFDFLEDGGRDFFDGFRCRREPADAFAAHQVFGFVDFVTAVFQRGVFAAGAALVADLREALGGDRQAEQLCLEWRQRTRQLAAFEVVGNQRVLSDRLRRRTLLFDPRTGSYTRHFESI